MSTYTEALKAYRGERKQQEVASELGLLQGSLSRYLDGRLPTREIAEQIDRRSGGKVPLSLWQISMAVKLGLAA